MKAIRADAPGGSETLRLVDVPEPRPREGEALVRIEAAGINFIDTYHRSGAYAARFPLLPGQEGAGAVVEIGAGVSEVRVGDRVAFASGPGTYAELVALPAARLVVVPEGVTTRQAAAVMLQGMTAHYLATSTYPLGPDDTCLVHAAAGGVGLLLCQLAKSRGARVFGTVSTEEKARRAREAGADQTIHYTTEDFGAETRRLTGGEGAQVVYDGVGRDTFEKSLDALAVRGTMVLFGQASGAVPPFDAQLLSRKGSLYLTRPTLAHYTRTREELLERATDVLGRVAAGKLSVRIFRELPLAEAAEAHRLLESRRTSGKLLLIP
ncbi:MAG TPA: quinone oxidoreductase [Thermoanaerobaculia bacterium]|nr:quinone oxidoreductase [Thermoanaerobaculia bacterium]